MGSTADGYETLLVTVDQGVGVVTLNRPQKLNAWTPRMGIELLEAVTVLDADEAIRAIVVTGAGRAFCAGADLAGGPDTFGDHRAEERARLATELEVDPSRPLTDLPTPIIAAINGPAVGVGLTVTLQFDIRIVADDATLCFPFSRRGVLPEMGSAWLLPRLIGTSTALDLLLTGRVFTGEEAARIGLASRALPAAEVLPRAIELAGEIAAATAPVSVGTIKRMVHSFLDIPRAEAQAIEDELFLWVSRQPDAREGPRAFLEKRAPRWTMGKHRGLPDLLFGSQPSGAGPLPPASAEAPRGDGVVT